ncbi:MAG: Asp-tRNA(Asn)/Glu-tRNA(Gln) amidotransferase subunit GatA [Candidatus Margulisiibacteriota bacterium]
MTLNTKTAHELHARLQSGEIKATELVNSVFQTIDQKDNDIKAYLSLRREKAIAEAEAIDLNIQKGEKLSPLEGIPIAVKDNICIQGEVTTCASKFLENFKSSYNATVIDRLRKAGMIIIGKTNMDEFAMGSSTENSAYQVTRNPRDTATVPGGSSGGSAAAVAADEAIVALGSDTGGSIRQPASFCGVVGMKPTYGRVSRYGLVAFASSLDQIGPLTKDVRDTAELLNVICGKDKMDSTSVDLPIPDFTKALNQDIQGLKIGVPKELIGEGVDEEVKNSVLSALDQLKQQGAEWAEISLPSFDKALSTYYIIAPAEASANLARYDGVKYGYRSKQAPTLRDMYFNTRSEGFGMEVKRRILIGTYVLSAGYYDAYYLKAQKARTLILNDFQKAFESYDVIISPTAPTTAFKVGEKTSDPLQMYMSDFATIPVNMAGLPAISIPCNISRGLPVGLQIIGKPFDEETVLKVAYSYEQGTK